MSLEKYSDLTLKRMTKVSEYLLPYSSKDFEGPVVELIKQARTAIKEGYGLYMHGNTGAGKSVIASDMICEWLRNQTIKEISNTLCVERLGDFPAFMESRRFLDDLKKSFDPLSKMKSHMLIETARKKSLLVIDDLYKGVSQDKIREWAGPTFGNLIEMRHSDMKPFIITSNYNLEEVAEYSHKSTASRIRGMCVLIDFSKIKDYRIQSSKERNL